MTFSPKIKDDTVNIIVREDLMDIKRSLNGVYMKDLLKNWLASYLKLCRQLCQLERKLFELA